MKKIEKIFGLVVLVTFFFSVFFQKKKSTREIIVVKGSGETVPTCRG